MSIGIRSTIILPCRFCSSTVISGIAWFRPDARVTSIPICIRSSIFGIQHLSPLLFDTILALAQSTAFMIAGFACVAIVRSSSASIDPRETTRLGLLGFALCLSAPIALSEAGTTFIDLITAVPVVGAYALLLQRDRMGPLVAAPLAGILLGAATALKLTNGVFALGAIGFALAGPDRPSLRLRWLTLCGASALLAFLAVGGSWHLSLWEHFRNPFFPYYNNIFHSPDFGTAALDDERFLPHSILDIWRYPLYWLLGGGTANGLGSPSCELYFWDARWAVVTIGGVAFLLGLARFPAWRKQCLANPATGLFFAVILAYLVWLAKFGYQRYMAPIDILCGAAILVLALQVSRARPRLATLARLSLWYLSFLFCESRTGAICHGGRIGRRSTPNDLISAAPRSSLSPACSPPYISPPACRLMRITSGLGTSSICGRRLTAPLPGSSSSTWPLPASV